MRGWSKLCCSWKWSSWLKNIVFTFAKNSRCPCPTFPGFLIWVQTFTNFLGPPEQGSSLVVVAEAAHSTRNTSLSRCGVNDMCWIYATLVPNLTYWHGLLIVSCHQKKRQIKSMKQFFQVSACLQWNHHVMCSKCIHCSSPPPSLWFSQFVPPNLSQCLLRRTRFQWLPVAFHDVPARCGLIRWSCHYPRNLWSP